MSTQRWQRVKSILADALDQPSFAARAAFIRESCADDTKLFREVEALLAQETPPGDEFEDCAENAANVLGRAESGQIGQRIGAYEIVEDLGRGGMGALYLAARADGEFEKRVAIKILKRGTDTDETLRRFRAERQILARLDHPNIAHLLDAGTTADGLPYFVMEYIAGKPITIFAREHQLSVDERLRLFLKVCAAVEFAHRNHVIHRDLKANNILVQNDGEPKLLDFGIAKLLASDGNPNITGTHDRRFTPVCASPEQARGEPVTSVSDVYALGALFYELLTDAPPHRFSAATPSFDEFARVVCEQEPLPPSAVARNQHTRRQLRGDLDTVALFALRKEPIRRYQSIAAFADDIRRHFERVPIRARANTISYRAQRFLARHRKEAPYLAFAAIVVLAFAALLWSHKSSEPTALATQNINSIPEKSVAVLPFETLTGQNDDRYFADGMQDNITTDLARVADLKVVGRESVREYRGEKRNLREIGKSLGVAHLLEGSVQRSGNRLRVNAQLVDARTGVQTWAEHYDREVTDLFAIESEVAQQIVTQLQATLSAREKATLTELPTKDFAAYELYLRASSRFHEFGIGPVFRANADEAIALLGQAIARDPDFARAYRLLAETHLYLYRYYEPKRERFQLAQEATDTALRLAPEISESHLMKARFNYFGSREFRAAKNELRLAARGLPNDPDLLELSAVVERRMGNWAAALRDGEKAVALDPHQPARLLSLAESYHGLHRFTEAERVANRAIASLPPKVTDPFSWIKSNAAMGRGDLKAAIVALENATGGLPDTRWRLARLLAFDHDYARANHEIDGLLAQEPQGYWLWAVKGLIAQTSGDEAVARTQYMQAYNLLAPKLKERPDDVALLSEMAPIAAALALKEEAIRTAQRATELVPTAVDHVDGPEYEIALAKTYSSLGESDQALHLLEQLAGAPCGPLVGELQLDPSWNHLRQDPRFARIVTEAALPVKASK
jgi:eukaryotic-like serine/threonine-protein kinase